MIVGLTWLDNDASIPDGFAILTPPADATVLSLHARTVKIDNLPWIFFNKESQLQLLLWQSLYDSATFRAVNNSDRSSRQIYYQGLENLEACHAQQSLVPSSIYSDTLGFGSMDPNLAYIFDPLPDFGSSYLDISLNSPPIGLLFSVCLEITMDNATAYLYTPLQSIDKSYMLEDNQVENYPGMILIAHSHPMVYQSFSLFIFMVTNNLLQLDSIRDIYKWANSNSCSWIFAEILKLKSTTIDVFATKLLPAAVELGDCDMVRNLISRNVDINTPIQTSWWREHFRTALSLAVGQRNMQMIKLLLDLGATPNIHEHDSRADSEASIASLWSHKSSQILQLLLERGADPDGFISNCQRGFPLIKAASEGHLEAVSLLIAAKANVNLSISDKGWTALQAATAGGHVQVVRALLKAKADVNLVRIVANPLDAHSYFGYCAPFQTPIQLAVKADNTKIATLLLQNGAKVDFCPILNAFDPEGIDTLFADHEGIAFTEAWPCAYAIQYATKNENIPFVRQLLAAGARVDSRIGVDQGDTPLQIAARIGNLKLVSLLLRHGADVNAPPGKCNGRTAIQAAAESGNIKIIQKLLDLHANVNASPGWASGRTALQAALEKGHINVARRLIRAGACINASPGYSSGLTALQAAVSFGDIEIVKEVLVHGADVNAAAGPLHGFTALQVSVKHENIDLLELLLKQGADVDAPPSEGQNKSALQYAVYIEWMEGVQLLLKYNPDVRKLPPYEDTEAFSALGWAIHHLSHNMMALLFDHGAGPNDPVRNGQDAPPTAFLYALSVLYSCEDIELFVKRGADILQFWGTKSALGVAIEANRDVGVVRMIIDLIIQTKTTTTTRNHSAASFQRSLTWIPFQPKQFTDTELIQILLDEGADIDAKCLEKKITILQNSAMYGTAQVCKILLQRGAEVNIKATKDVGTPLQEAILCQRETKIPYLLLEHGADVNALPAEKRGVTALQAAAIRGYLPLARRLLELGADVTAAPASIDGRTAIDGAAEHGHLDMLQLLLNAYGDREGLAAVCNQAASFADKEGHVVIASWLRGYTAS